MVLFPYNKHMGNLADRRSHQKLSCYRKKQYSSWTHAQHDAKSINRRDPTGYAEPYHCTSCGKFHVGNKSKRLHGKKRHTTRTR